LTAESHAEYDLENTYLEHALRAIDASIARAESIQGEAADHLTEEDVRLTAHYDIKTLRSMRPSPYFGRIDFRQKDRPRIENLYIGRKAVWGESADDLLIIDWRAPASSLFYSGQTAAARYQAPEGIVEGVVLLRRRFDIADACLRRIMDEFDRRERAAAAAVAIPVDPDEYLRQLLSSTTDGRLHDIVATIRAEQDEVIRAPHDRTLLIQGVPGSGKTSVALHRLAYLLYPGAKRGFKPERVLLVGPNRVFLHYVAEVLPELDAHRIPQTTFADWAARRMGLAGHGRKARGVESVLAPATDPAQEPLSQQSRLKGSLRMARVVRRYVDSRRRQMAALGQGLEYRQVGPLKVALRAEPQEIQALHARYQEAPLNTYRKMLLTELTALLDRKYEARLLEMAQAIDWQADPQTRFRGAGPDPGPPPSRVALDVAMQPTERDLTRKSLELHVAEDLRRLVPPMAFPQDYYRLFRQPEILAQAAQGILNGEEIRTLVSSPPSPRQPLPLDDVPLLYYFYIALHGVPEPNYDHVVVDEAQDLSPLALRLLRAHVPAGSMTVIGDVGQAVYAHRGFTSWDALGEVFEGVSTQYAELTCSYRSTAEITRFANGLRQRLHGQAAEPFERHGVEPVLRGAPSEPEYLNEIVAAIRTLQDAQCRTVAIITKTAERCAALYRALAEHGVADLQLAADTDADFRGKVLIVPVYLSKGLEFDGAVVVDVDAGTYADTEDDTRLLYVAITRPLHYLYVLWQGQASPLLAHRVPRQT
jgi:DNA helicase-2/ATP-dependent DNA helicase PcrA